KSPPSPSRKTLCTIFRATAKLLNMKLVLIFLFFCFQSDQTGKLIFFRIDESIPMENISFGKNEIERWNRIIKVKSTSNIVFEFDYENRKHNFAVSKSSILKLNSISFVKQTEKTNL